MQDAAPLPPPQGSEQGPSTLAAEAERTIRAVLEQKGIGHSSQASALSELLHITAKQVRRKFKDGIWSLQELLVIQNHYGSSLAGVLAGGVGMDSGPRLEAATLSINGKAIECEVRVGPAMTSVTGSGLACSRLKDKWLVSTFAALDEVAPHELRYAVDLLQVLDSGTALKIAVLDDDDEASSSLTSWFNHSGYPAQSFTTSEALQKVGLENFDVFVMDVILSSGETSYKLVEEIRSIDPDAVIVLLTGKLRGNAPLEAELAAIVRDKRVEFYEKPTRPALLLASILNAVSRRPTA